ncbi:hypothetical protein A5664_18000 [Mycolicibacterium fortuitum]|uniref:acyl carrier protein n=1 Tax=Mycolicibacterium fortuitum TaxID=1766 RepID=UPI0007EDA7E2|nr:acyl carrier protein [Mycolicibacterium fortuitum]OBI78438.1 hypothetical protein A5664_18000 [Mycolicibacterium fortuitum]
MNNRHGGDPEFDRLIEQSSLGTAGARRLRGRVSPAQVEKVRRRLIEADQTQHADSGADVRVGVPDRPAGRRAIFVSFQWTHASVIAAVREIVARAMAVDLNAINTEQPLFEQGLDSLTMVEARTAIERTFDVALAPEMIWEQPSTVAQLADYILEQHHDGRPKPVASQGPMSLGPRAAVTDEFGKRSH